MPKFSYLIMQSDRSQRAGVLESADAEAARVDLQQWGVLLTLQEVSEPRWWNSWLGPAGVKTREVHLFTRELASLIGGGVALTRAFQLLGKARNGRPFGQVIDSVTVQICSGVTLHEAMAKHPEAFSPLYVAMIEAGESSGRLVLVLQQLARHIEERLRLEARVRGALAYPAVILSVACLVATFFCLRIVPTFAACFLRLGIDLPWLTRALFEVSSLMLHNLIPLGAGLLAAGATLRGYLSTDAGRRRRARLLLELPLLKDLYVAALMEHFFSLMALLLSSGIQALAALELAQKSVAGNPVFTDALREVMARVASGIPLSRALELTGIFPEMATDNLKIAEESGSLIEDMGVLSGYYKEKLDFALSELLVYMEPVLVLLVSVIVGVLLFAVFMPIFKIGDMKPT